MEKFKKKLTISDIQKELDSKGIVISNAIKTPEYSKHLDGILNKTPIGVVNAEEEAKTLKDLSDPLTTVKDVRIDHLTATEIVLGGTRFNAHSAIKSQPMIFAGIETDEKDQTKKLRGDSTLLTAFDKHSKMLAMLTFKIKAIGYHYLYETNDLKKDKYFALMDTEVRAWVRDLGSTEKANLKALNFVVAKPNGEDSWTVLNNGLANLTNVILFVLQETHYRQAIIDNLIANNQSTGLLTIKHSNMRQNMDLVASVPKSRSAVAIIDSALSENGQMFIDEQNYVDAYQQWFRMFSLDGNSDSATVVPVITIEGNDGYSIIDTSDDNNVIYDGAPDRELSNLTDYFTGTVDRINEELEYLDANATSWTNEVDDILSVLKLLPLGIVTQFSKAKGQDTRLYSNKIFDTHFLRLFNWYNAKTNNKLPFTVDVKNKIITADLNNQELNYKIPYFDGGYSIGDEFSTIKMLPHLEGAKIAFDFRLDLDAIYIFDSNGQLQPEFVFDIINNVPVLSFKASLTETFELIKSQLDNLLWYYGVALLDDKEGEIISTDYRFNSAIYRISSAYAKDVMIHMENFHVSRFKINSAVVVKAAKTVLSNRKKAFDRNKDKEEKNPTI